MEVTARGEGLRRLTPLTTAISAILWWSVFLVEETGLPGENFQPLSSYRQTISHNCVSSTPHHERVCFHEKDSA